MNINLKKQKLYMVLQKHNSKLQNTNFSLGDQRIDITSEYTYLGLQNLPKTQNLMLQLNNWVKKLCMHYLKSENN